MLKTFGKKDILQHRKKIDFYVIVVKVSLNWL